jgi:predicted metal-binding protein
MDPAAKDYIVVVQCDIVMQRCSGYLCERAFHERTGGFAAYPAERDYRTLYITCGGCCGRALHRKLTHLGRTILKKEGVAKDRVVVQLASCVTNDNFHAPPCPHIEYLRTLIARAGFDCADQTHIDKTSHARRTDGTYHS